VSDRVPVVAPDLQAGPDAAVLGQWHAEPGDRVFAGDALLELLVPGLTVSVSCPVDGILAEICRQASVALHPGEILAWVVPDAPERDDEPGA
jgi:pyruvate/2-oxoglutarate dehydrogenase complex dihydrolipoamide acyltransferase (E2) component